MKIAVFSDCHILAPHEVAGIRDEIFQPDLIKTKYEVDDVVLTGDIIDVKNALNKKVKRARALVARLQAIYGGKYVLGNHACTRPQKYFYIHKETRTVFFHGHT